MAEPMRVAGELSTAELASFGILPKQPEGENLMDPSTKDEIKGTFQEVKGKVREAAGKVTNNPNLEVEGKVEQNAGTVEKKVGQIEKVLEK
jgi:uncharacterized protein YjbJ (UPF0337 family)